MGNQKHNDAVRSPSARSSGTAARRHVDEQTTDLFLTLREPERSEMVDFSDVFPAITREFLASQSDLERTPRERTSRKRIPHAPVVIGSKPARHHSHSVHRSRLFSETYHTHQSQLLELLELSSYPPLRHLYPWFKQAHVQLGQVSQLLPLLRPRAKSIWKLWPVWMLANLALLILVLLVMLSQGLPKSLVQSASSSSCEWYTVANNETLYAISASYHLAASTVAEANHLKNYGAIRPGQRLCIPLANGILLPAAQDALVAPSSIATGPVVKGPAQFIQFALPYADSAHQQTGWPVSMILAQWALEHGWSVPGFTGYNWGNVAALPGVPHVASGGAPGAPANFSYAPTPQDGVNYYVAVASLSYYSLVAPAARHGGPNAAARALGASPWDAAHYTGDDSPGSSLITIMQSFNLYHYDT